MIKIDWNYLRSPLLWFAMAIIVVSALAVGGYQFEKLQYDEYQQSMTKLRSTHGRYRKLVDDIDLLEQYRTLYIGYKSTGLVGQERRLSWIESLEATNQVLRLPKLGYNLNPQEDFARPGYKLKRGVEVKSSAMDLSIDMLHEEDLFALLEGLRQSIDNLFTVDSCTLIRSGGVTAKLATKSANLITSCTIRWITVDAK